MRVQTTKSEVDNEKGHRGLIYNAIESVFITTTVDAQEGRDVAIFNISGEYIHTEIDNGCNHVSGRIIIWPHCEGNTQDISKVCHHDQQDT